jgi:predicted permease
MRMLREWLHRLWATAHPRRGDEDLEEELRSHLDLAADHERRGGRAPADAERRARLTAGAPAQAMEQLRDQRGLPWLEDLGRDVRHGLRTLAGSPAFTAVSLLTLALGIGANAAVFQLVDAIRLRALPVQDARQLAIVELADTTRWKGRRTSGYPVLTNPLWEEFRDRQRAFSGVLAWSNADLRLGRDGAVRSVKGLFVSGGFFEVLGVGPVLGRLLTAADDRPGCGLPGAVLSHGFWQRELGAEPRVIGRTIAVNGQPLEVIGVTAAGFFGVEVGRAYDVAVPICSQEALGAEDGWLNSGTTWWLTVMGRVPRDQPLERVNAQLAADSPGLFRATLPAGYPSADARDYLSFTLRAVSGGAGVSSLRSRFSDPLMILLATTGLVLLITCTNLASLVLSRAASRQRELAVRLALGASRGRLVRQLMTENGLLAAAGAAAGLALAGVLSRLLIGFLGADVSVALRTDGVLIGVVILSAVLTCLTFGLIPAWMVSRAAARASMTGAQVRGSAARSEGFRLRQALVVSQVAISLVLLFGALLFVGTVRNLLAVDSGFQHGEVAIARVSFARAALPPSGKTAFKRDLLDRIRSTPGVSAAAEVRHVPMGGTGSSLTVWLEGSDPSGKIAIRLNPISDGYLQTMGIGLIAGRDFTRHDSASSPKVALVNPAFVRRLGLAGEPVGARFRVEGAPPSASVYEIVGVVPDTKHFTLREDFLPIAFVPVAQATDPRAFTDFVIRSIAPPGDVSSGVRRGLAGISPSIDVDVRPFDATIRQGLVRERLMAALSGFFGVLAVVIAAIGLYGVMAELVTRRRSEIGLRIALGARRLDILGMVIRQAGTLLLAGLAAGALLAFAAAGSVRSVVFGLEPRGVGVICLACGCLAVAAMAAILVPACRAAMVEPLAALRDE